MAISDMPGANQQHAGISVLVVSRNSGQQSKQARQQAARELHAAVDGLKMLTGQDLAREIPSEETIIQRLRTTKRERSHTSDGKAFTNEYLLEHLPANNAAVLVSTGTGVKLSEDFTQPFLNHVAEVVLTLRPSLVFVHRLDRLFRHDLAAAHLLSVLREIGCELADGELGYQAPGSIGSLMTLIRAQGSAEEAKRIPIKTRAGMTAGTGTSMKGKNTVSYAAAVTPPPGMTVIRLRTDTGTKGPAALFFDRPSSLPDPATVAYGRPNVAINGKPVDQVAIVKMILATLGQPGSHLSAVARFAMSLGFSTHKLRLMHGMAAQWVDYAPANAPASVLRAVVSNLDFYESGQFTVRLGIQGVENLLISGCFPAGSPWATSEDFLRIRNYLAQTNGGGPATMGLTGVKVTTAVGTGYLKKASKSRDATGQAYLVRAKRGESLPAKLPVIPHHLLAESIVKGLIDKAESCWIPLNLGHTPEIGQLQLQIVTAEREVGILDAKAKRMREFSIQEVTGRLLEDLNRDYDSLVNGPLAEQTAKVKGLEKELAVLTQKVADNNGAAEDSILLDLVASLRDHSNTEWNDLWKKAVSLNIKREPVRINGHKGILITWTGSLRIIGAGHTFEAPFTGRMLTGAAGEVENKVQQVIRNLEQGVPYPQQEDVTQKKALRTAVAKHLGLKGKQHQLLTTLDREQIAQILLDLRDRDYCVLAA
jgi:hypothetical protein